MQPGNHAGDVAIPHEVFGEASGGLITGGIGQLAAVKVIPLSEAVGVDNRLMASGDDLRKHLCQHPRRELGTMERGVVRRLLHKPTRCGDKRLGDLQPLGDR